MIMLSIGFWFVGSIFMIITEQWLGFGLGFVIMAATFRIVEAIEK